MQPDGPQSGLQPRRRGERVSPAVSGRIGEDGVEIEVRCSGEVARRIQLRAVAGQVVLDVEDANPAEPSGQVGG